MEIESPYNRPRKIIWPIFLLGIIFFIVGICGIIWGEVIPLYQAFQSRNWVEVNCKIVDSGYSLSDETVLGIEVPIYRANIEYQFRWSGQIYTGNAFKEHAMETEYEAKSLAEKFPVGKEVGGFLNPEDPNQNALTMRSFGWSDLLVIFMMLVSMLGGAFLTVSGYSNFKDNDDIIRS